MEDPVMLGVRGVAIGLALALMLAGAGLPRPARWALLPVLGCLVAYLLRSAPEARGWPALALLLLSIGALMFPAAFWWLVHRAFDDRGDIPPYAVPGAVVMVAAGLLGGPAAAGLGLGGDGSLLLQKACGAAFVLAALWRLWRGGSEDLVAGRRVVRHALLAYIGTHGLVVLGVESWLRRGAAPAWLDALNVGVIAVALAITLVLLVGFRSDAVERFFGPPQAPAATPAPQAARAPGDDASAALDDRWLERLERLMRAEHAYRDPELSLSRLAGRVGLPEYRLRELIHHRLGWRNFPAFVNEHRLREVEQRLADPAFDRQPILTLALDAGFGSIGPFNRAFRERHGVTPTAFRTARGVPDSAR